MVAKLHTLLGTEFVTIESSGCKQIEQLVSRASIPISSHDCNTGRIKVSDGRVVAGLERLMWRDGPSEAANVSSSDVH